MASAIYTLKDLFPKFPTTDVATADGNSLGGQRPGAHVTLVEAESRRWRPCAEKQEQRKEGKNHEHQPYGISTDIEARKYTRGAGPFFTACAQNTKMLEDTE